MATAVRYAPHVENFLSSSYKRNFSQIGDISTTGPYTGKKQMVPSVETPNTVVPSTSARPDQRVNVRVPVARLCGAPLHAGQIAFVSRSQGPINGLSSETAPTFVGTHELSLESLNELLSMPLHHVNLANDPGALLSEFFKKRVATGIVTRKLQGKKLVFQRPEARVFDINDFFQKDGRSINHPLMNFALDGVVCTNSDEPGLTTAAICNVAVKGMCPVLMHRPIHDKMRAVAVAPYPQTLVRPANFYVQPIEMLAAVYVVLVAVRTAPGSGVWFFQYELVSSTNVIAKHGFKRFRSTIMEGDTPKNDSNRLVLSVTTLGRVVDTNFGDPKSPSIVVDVNIRPFEATKRHILPMPALEKPYALSDVAFSQPVHVWKSFTTFDKPTNFTPGGLTAAGISRSPVSKQSKQFPSSFRKLLAATGQNAQVQKLQETIDDLKKQLDRVKKTSDEAMGLAKGAAETANETQTLISKMELQLKDDVHPIKDRLELVRQNIGLMEERSEKERKLIIASLTSNYDELKKMINNTRGTLSEQFLSEFNKLKEELDEKIKDEASDYSSETSEESQEPQETSENAGRIEFERGAKALEKEPL